MWDPNIGMGTVTHQNIGYLFPMGPYYWVLHLLGVPAWVSQRLWFGTILFAAGVGMLYLLRTLRVRGPGVVVATLVFMLTPYTLDFAARISVILLPWAGLPWMLALVIRALRRRWRSGTAITDSWELAVPGDLRHRRADRRRGERDRARSSRGSRRCCGSSTRSRRARSRGDAR